MSSLPVMRRVGDIARVHAARQPDAIAMVYQGRATSYAELDRRANRVANALIGAGVKPQARIAYLGKNSDAFFELMFGAAKANVVLVSVNWRLAPPEIAYVINDATTEVLFVGPDYFEIIDKIRGELKTVKHIVALGATHGDWPSYEAWRDRAADTDPALPVAGSDVALQLYTSGTTGNPKGAQLTHDNMLTLMPGALAWGDWDASDVSLVCMPLFHIGGSGWALAGFYAGSRNVIAREIVPAEILKLIAEQRITRTFFVPAVILFLLQTPGVQEADLSSLKLVIYGASPMPLDLVKKAMAVLKCEFAQVYGLTETTGAITYLPPEDHTEAAGERLKSCGRAMEGVELRVADATGEEVPVGQVGEILCRSVQNMKGYWNLPRETQNTIRGEWLHTGDVGYLDKDGYLYIYDRVKDMIISGGENIYPAEVESALFGHPAIADVAVIGVPDPTWGEAVKAIVVLKPGASASAQELIDYARERIAHYKAPKSVDFVQALPRTPTGKILKRELRAPYWKGRERQVL
jgi:long-chain acyl-CoA synthetase